MSTTAPLIGRLAADPSLQFSKEGKPIARFTIVTSGRRLNKATNTWEDVDTSFWRCTAFDQLAEQIAENLEKGAAVIAVGTISQDDWTDKEGSQRTSLKAVINNLGPDLRWAKPRDSSSSSSSSRSRPSFEENPPF
jgi:single-strand DNA-binding protein